MTERLCSEIQNINSLEEIDKIKLLTIRRAKEIRERLIEEKKNEKNSEVLFKNLKVGDKVKYFISSGKNKRIENGIVTRITFSTVFLTNEDMEIIWRYPSSIICIVK